MAHAHVVSDDLATLNVADADYWEAGTYAPLFDRLRAEDPVHYCPESAYGPYWSITKYDDIMSVDTNHQVFSSATKHGGIMMDDDIVAGTGEQAPLESFITSDDPPKHGPQRKAVNGIVGRPNLEHFEKIIRERTANILDGLPVGEEFDWVPNVSIELTTMMLATLFDFPFEDRHKLTWWSDLTTTEPGMGLVETQEERMAGLLECLEYFTDLWKQRENNEGGLDLVSMLSQNPDTKDMEPMNYLGNLLLLIVGGNDTTRNSMSGGVWAFHNFPEELDKLKADASLMNRLNSEVIRWQTPLSHMRRTAVADAELGGKQIKKGDKVVMWYYSGNRDEDHFTDGHRLDLNRPNANTHMSFGFGIHRCMGLRLADLQLKIIWQEILKRWDRIEVVGEPSRVKSNFVHGFTSLPVKIHA